MPFGWENGKSDLVMFERGGRKILSIAHCVCMFDGCNEEPFAAQR
jgi:hypothetical protein